MAEPNRRPGVLWTVAVLALGLVLYILSAGPSAWLIAKNGFPEWLLVPYEVIYKPLELADAQLPVQITKPYNQYVEWWIADFLPPPVTPRGASPAPVPTGESAEEPAE